MKTSVAKNEFALFLARFGELCRAHGGIYNEQDAIGDSAAYRIPTPFGELRASTDFYSAGPGHVHKTKLGTVYLCWRDCTGPVPFPLHGDFNQCSHKWNIQCFGGTLAQNREQALNELRVRLELLAEMEVPS